VAVVEDQAQTVVAERQFGHSTLPSQGQTSREDFR
jgi:hypothetical protein